MEDDVDALEVRAHRLAVANIELDEPCLAGRDRRREIFRNAADERIKRDDLARAGRDRGIDDVRADVACAASHGDASAHKDAHPRVRTA